MGKIKDLTGKNFNGVEVLSFVEIKNHSAMWKCKCSCGNLFITRGADLSNGHTKSCGCKNIEKARKMGLKNKGKGAKNLTNQRFGKLVALYPTEKRDSCRSIIWHCKCDCGNEIDISSHSLQQGTQSCGCLFSKGELAIRNLLLENNINFETQKTFETCLFMTGWPARFDFYLPDYNLLIEYDGEQHFGVGGWNTPGLFEETKIRDNFKNEWCKKNNIPLIRIPYTHLSELTLDDLLLNSSFKII